ncbi:MAG: N-acetyl-gamma-glutamyl-phosphate reductase [Verrucomicrobia bacterium]|nr:N-acetyl-gamma-glutamyl-phosphate reductase [Verrucomicrobiota bacterium]MBV8377735.1 N-acetyl-gamma-glutamyl-phosphate reductase [Verrucomicrobiota bacterium]
MKKAKVAIFGASGYSGEELVKRLAEHPLAELGCLTSRQYAGKKASEVFHWIGPRSPLASLEFSDPGMASLPSLGVEFAFLALPHGVAFESAVPLLEMGIRVIDLSADFRVKDPNVYQYFYKLEHPAPALLQRSVYGLPEAYREQIREAKLVACPGCYPTSILIPLLPVVRARMIRLASIVVNSLSGVSGAGRKAEMELLFVECNESARPYGLPSHRHLSEVEQELSIAAKEPVIIQFAPHLIPLSRGIITTIHAEPVAGLTQESLDAVYESAYGSEWFIRLLGSHRYPDVKNVVGTNHLEIAWRVDPRTGRIILMSAEDNIVKGAAGQAIQCFNIMNAWDEALGLGM